MLALLWYEIVMDYLPATELTPNPRIKTLPPQEIVQREMGLADHIAVQLANVPPLPPKTRRIWERIPTLDAGLFVLACVFNKSQGTRGKYDLRQISYHLNTFYGHELSKPEYNMEISPNGVTPDMAGHRLKSFETIGMTFLDLSRYDERLATREYYRPPHARTAAYLERLRGQR